MKVFGKLEYMASSIFRQMLYLIEGLKLELVLLFFGALAASILIVSNKLGAPAVTATAHAAALPYTTTHPYDYRLAAAEARQAAAAALAAGPMWPLHGKVTTEFGASDYPYQSSHTGIDISDGMPAGHSNVVAFKAGTVISVVHASTSYGNHVVIDHGSGLTSLYGHLYAIRVTVGQQVHAGDVIGIEGDSGASTGTHVHFEIRQNNVPQNPRRYIPGNP